MYKKINLPNNATREAIYIFLILLFATLSYFSFQSNKSLHQKIESLKPPVAYDADDEKYQWTTEVVATNLETIWDMAQDEEGRLFFNERPGKLKVLEIDGMVKTLAELPQVVSVGESGLTGLALHPNFAQNRYIYLYYTYRDAGQLLNRVSRFRLINDKLIDETFILDRLAGGSIHNGGRLRFGPDNKLWVLTGDAARPSFAQDASNLSGKVLRLNEDGSIPEDNPTKNSLIYSMGHRNPQGLAWHPLTEELLVTEHGETAHDEINIINPNANYGWPNSKKCYSDDKSLTGPIICSGEETFAPSGLASFGTEIWRLRNSFIYAGLRGNRLERFEVISGEVSQREVIIKGGYGRLRSVLIDKTGTIFVGTSNKDGRGNPADDDDKILKITPKLVE